MCQSRLLLLKFLLLNPEQTCVFVCVARVMHDEVSDTENIRKNLAIERMIVEGCDILLDTSQTFVRQGESSSVQSKPQRQQIFEGFLDSKKFLFCQLVISNSVKLEIFHCLMALAMRQGLSLCQLFQLKCRCGTEWYIFF